MTIINTLKYYRSLYLRTDSQLFESWYHRTTWNFSANARIISYP